MVGLTDIIGIYSGGLWFDFFVNLVLFSFLAWRIFGERFKQGVWSVVIGFVASLIVYFFQKSSGENYVGMFGPWMYLFVVILAVVLAFNVFREHGGEILLACMGVYVLFYVWWFFQNGEWLNLNLGRYGVLFDTTGLFGALFMFSVIFGVVGLAGRGIGKN